MNSIWPGNGLTALVAVAEDISERLRDLGCPRKKVAIKIHQAKTGLSIAGDMATKRLCTS
jgi:hypothetical protein